MSRLLLFVFIYTFKIFLYIILHIIFTYIIYTLYIFKYTFIILYIYFQCQDVLLQNLLLWGKTSIASHIWKMSQPLLLNIEGQNYIWAIIQLIIPLFPEITLISFIRRRYKDFIVACSFLMKHLLSQILCMFFFQ